MRDVLLTIADLLDDIKTAVETIATNTTPTTPTDDSEPGNDNT